MVKAPKYDSGDAFGDLLNKQNARGTWLERDLLDAKIFSGADESDAILTPRMKLQLKKMREGAVLSFGSWAFCEK